MIRFAIGALAASVFAYSALAQGGGVQPAPGPLPEPEPIPVSFCNDITNGDFSIGSAFWSVDIETGEFGDTATGVFTSFTPLSLAPNNGNIATFFTESLAEGDCEFHLGSAANSTVLFSRRLITAPGGRLQFQFGGRLSFIAIGDGAVRYSLTLIVRNETTGQEAKCRLASGSVSAAEQSLSGVEGEVIIPFQTFNICRCPDLRDLATAGDTIEILLIPSVRSDSTQEGGSAFIGGPFFFDNVRFCNILCPIPLPIDQPVARVLLDSRPLSADALELDGEQLRLRALDSNSDGVFDDADYKPVPEFTKPTLDVDGDGAVTLDDAVIIVDTLGGLIEPSVNADVNGDGMVDENDLKIVLKAADPG